MSNTPQLSWTYKAAALKQVANHLGREHVNGMLGEGFKHMGVYNGEHCIMQNQGPGEFRVWCVDLIINRVTVAL